MVVECPFICAIAVEFVLPDRDVVLDGVDDVAAGIESNATVSGTDPDPHCEGHATVPLLCLQPDDLRAAGPAGLAAAGRSP